MSMSKADILHSVIIEAIDSAVFDEKKNSELTGWVGELYDIADDVIYKENLDKLVEFVKSVAKIEHKRGGSLSVGGQFHYKVPESIFDNAEKILKELGHEI